MRFRTTLPARVEDRWSAAEPVGDLEVGQVWEPARFGSLDKEHRVDCFLCGDTEQSAPPRDAFVLDDALVELVDGIEPAAVQGAGQTEAALEQTSTGAYKAHRRLLRNRRSRTSTTSSSSVIATMT